MAEFEKFRGQIEGMWTAAMKDAELQGRKGGAAAAVEKVWQVGEKLAQERADAGQEHMPVREVLRELRARVGGEPGLLTEDEWARVREALGEIRRITKRSDEERLTLREWEARQARSPFGWGEGGEYAPPAQVIPGADERPGYRVGDVAAPLPDTIAQAQAEEEAADRSATSWDGSLPMREARSEEEAVAQGVLNRAD